MIPALNLKRIEEEVRGRETKAALLVFSSFNGEDQGDNVSFLSKMTDYHFHAGKEADLFCVGYSAYEPQPNNKQGAFFEVSQFGKPLTYFYPEIFHSVRRDISRSLNRKWSYDGGVDLLLFPALYGSEAGVDWQMAAVLKSRDLVNGTFQDIDHMVRTVINLNEEMSGDLTPHELNPEINRRVFINRVSAVAEKYGGVIASAITLVF